MKKTLALVKALGKTVVAVERERNEALKCLAALVHLYVANPSTEGQFVVCRTPDGNMEEWDEAMRLLGRPLHPKRRRSKARNDQREAT